MKQSFAQRTYDRPQELYKTELCKSIQDFGTCRYGVKCRFAHGLSELRPVVRHKNYKTEMCHYNMESKNCPYGARCRFIHNDDDVNPYINPFLIRGDNPRPTKKLDVVSYEMPGLEKHHRGDHRGGERRHLVETLCQEPSSDTQFDWELPEILDPLVHDLHDTHAMDIEQFADDLADMHIEQPSRPTFSRNTESMGQANHQYEMDKSRRLFSHPTTAYLQRKKAQYMDVQRVTRPASQHFHYQDEAPSHLVRKRAFKGISALDLAWEFRRDSYDSDELTPLTSASSAIMSASSFEDNP